MKLQFFRKRSTSTTVTDDTNSLKRQAMTWNQSFNNLLGNKTGLNFFMQFLRSEFSEENLEFWISCQDFKYCKETEITFYAQNIYQDCIASKSPKEVIVIILS